MGRFEQIYEEHQEALRVFVQRRAPESIVDDVVSETFLICWRKLERIPDEPLPWLYAVARKTLANQRRRLAREQRVDAADPASAVAELEPVGDTALAAAFAALSEHDREVLRLIAWEGLSLSQAPLGNAPARQQERSRLLRGPPRRRRLLLRNRVEGSQGRWL